MVIQYKPRGTDIWKEYGPYQDASECRERLDYLIRLIPEFEWRILGEPPESRVLWQQSGF